MKFKDIFNEAAKQYLAEQEMQNIESSETEIAAPEQSGEIDSALPTEETIDLNEEKYKALLLMVQKALTIAYKDNVEKRSKIADLRQKIEQDPKTAEGLLSNELELSESDFPEDSFK